MSKELEKVISKLSQKSKAKAEAEKKVEPVKEEIDQDAEDLKTLTEDPAPEVESTPAEASEPSTQAMSKLDELEQQVVRLRDDGIYRVELLFQLQEINQGIKNLNDFFKKLVSEDEEKE